MIYEHKGFSYISEEDLKESGFPKIGGVDECGRGCLFGPMAAACIILNPAIKIKGVRDSKKLSRAKREELYEKLTESALSISIAVATAERIDEINIYQATKECIQKAVSNMELAPNFVFIDGKFDSLNLSVPYTCVPGADGAQIYDDVDGRRQQVSHHYESVAAASIIAKVYRDRLMLEYDKIYPQYGLKNHFGYATEEHREAIRKYGLSPLHRRTFGICKEFE